MPEPQHQTSEEPQEQSQTDRKRIQYTPELKLKLMQLCIQNGDRYIETIPNVVNSNSIRTLFRSVTKFNTGNGSTIRRKVADIVSERKAAITLRRAQQSLHLLIWSKQLIPGSNEWIGVERRNKRRMHSTQISKQRHSVELCQPDY